MRAKAETRGPRACPAREVAPLDAAQDRRWITARLLARRHRYAPRRRSAPSLVRDRPRGTPLTGQAQASVELVAGLPALLLATVLALQLFLVGYSLTIADGAAEAGALAGAAGKDARAAARQALPGWARERSSVSAEGGRVNVELRPPAPLRALADALAVSSSAWSRPPGGERR
jgi:hypothetical protein